MATENAAPEKLMTLDRSNGSATIELYRAALGPVQVGDYLKAFTRFDAAGKTGPGWNWAAALLTLNWMAFYRLWGAALAYAGALIATLLLLFGILPLIVTLPQAGLWALLGLALLLAVAVPGVFGNAWLYAACNKAMHHAYSASATQEEACALLQKRAPGRQRLLGLAAGNLTLCVALAVMVLTWHASSTLPLNSGKMEQARVQAASVALTSDSTALPAAGAASAAASTPSRSSQGQVQIQQPEPAASAALIAPAASAAAQAVAATASSAAPAPLARASAAVSKTEKKAESKADNTAEKYMVNVGLFADANNARNAYTKLMDAGLPALSQELHSTKGQRTRVRVGPFESRAEADTAAEKIRALKLEAQVSKP